MARRTSGLRKRGDIWHIQKTINGVRLWESTGESEIEKAEQYLARRIEQIRQEKVYGIKQRRTFIEAATRYLNEQEKKSLARDAITLKHVVPYIGQIQLERIHIGTLAEFIADRKAAGCSVGTINRDLAIVRRVLALSARLWRDDEGRPWLDTVPLLPMLKGETRKPYPLTWDEQTRLLAELPSHVATLALFLVNTGCREQEAVKLKWREEMKLPTCSIFVLEEGRTKAGRERIIVLNRIAASIIEQQRGQSGEWVFPFGKDGKPLDRINNKSWRSARKRAGLEKVRVHDLRHTFGRRLRAAGVSFEDRQDLLGHSSGRVTTHYSAAEIRNLIDAVNLICDRDDKPELTLIRLAK